MTVDVLASVPDGSGALAACFDARDYHNGQWSELYALASSGKVRSLWVLGVELREAIDIADGLDDGIEAAENFRALLAWVESQPNDEEDNQ